MSRRPEQLQSLREAQALIDSAIALLDSVAAPAHIAARLELALHQLAALVDNGGACVPARDSGRHFN